ncbi:hypothetical protein DNL40_11470 [Xylanimonas oleitrophica]|uniref:Uncharacterized protein n=1 Tax=Xylanimonas oleitrophica TaxID=2607479 RepID=A0A2W5YDZ6_9MICO|nr:hypothetical protein [Xylanimonas oleitrophica]PZR52561.1 hypothetical protein DNL40_11470 [Xylanimonas oleitrophica]
MSETDTDALVDALYAGPLEEFVAARDAAAKQVAAGGDRVGAARVKKLRRPTVAAWVVNQVARRHPDEVAALASLGDELRAATADRDRGRITALDRLRRERTDALVGQVREAGDIDGRPVSTDALDRLAETLTAAVMDPDAAAAVRGGRLAQALQHVGFGIVDEGGDTADVVALRREAGDPPPTEPGGGAKPATRPEPEAGPEREADTVPEPPAEALADAERAVQETADGVDRLEARRDDLDQAFQAAQAQVRQREAEVGRLEEEMQRLLTARDEARAALREAQAAQEESRAALDAVDAELDAAEGRAAAARRRRRDARRTDT